MSKLITKSSASQDENICPANAYQKLNVCVPVKVKPYATPGSTTTICCGEPTITSDNTNCYGEEDGFCSFTISQTICVTVPILFGATASVDKTYVDCIETSKKNICEGCTEYTDCVDCADCANCAKS